MSLILELAARKWKKPRFSSYLCAFLCFIRKNIEINVVDDEEYEKNEIFYVVLGEPKVVKKDEDKDSGAGTEEVYDAEKERLEELGKPRLGTFVS